MPRASVLSFGEAGRPASVGGTEVCVGAAGLRSCRRHPLFFFEIVTLLRPHRDNGRKRPSQREVGSQEGSADPGPGPADPPHRGKRQMTSSEPQLRTANIFDFDFYPGWVGVGGHRRSPAGTPLSGRPALRTALSPGQVVAQCSQAEPRPLQLPLACAHPTPTSWKEGLPFLCSKELLQK